MKKKLIIILTLFSLLAAIGGANLIVVIGRSASNFDELIQLHQVEILREHLLLSVYQVQEDLYSQSAMHPESLDAIMHHVNELDGAVNTCFGCHHNNDIMERLWDLRGQIDQYSHALSRILTLHGNTRRTQEEQEKAHIIGESLISKVNTMIVLTNKKLNKRTEDSLQHLHRTRLIVILLVAAGPLLVAVFGFLGMGSITKPIQSLVAATQRLKGGDLDHRIVGLKDEFGELATAFNDMAGSLRENMRAIEESEKRYRLLFETAADAIFILDPEGDQPGKIVQANEAAGSMHGYSQEELRSMRVQDIDTPQSAAHAADRIRRLVKGEHLKLEMEHRKKDGTVFPVEVSAGVFAVGGHKYILAIDRDITQRKQAEETLQRIERIRLAGELATGLAHEIKNPLAGIKVAMAALSEEDYLSEEDRDVLKRVIDEIRRIESLMKELLSFARPPKPHLTETDVNTVLEAVASLAIKNHSTGNGDHPISVVRDFETRLPEILADPMQLQQIFMNLLLNAVDAMPDGGTLSMRTSFEQEPGSVRIDISDTGVGVDASVVEKLFQPFFTTKPKGTGLGLAITRRLVEEHGGRITLRSNLGGGVTFTVRLPVTPQYEGAAKA